MKHFRLLGLVCLAISSLVLVGCDSPDKVHVGDTATIEYTSTFVDGMHFQSSGATFVVGSGQIIAGLDKGVLGMKAGQTKTITVTPDEGYASNYKANLLQKISKVLFDKMRTSDGTSDTTFAIGGVQGVVKGMEKDKDGNEVVLFDINPRETREDIIYKVTLVNKE